MSRPPRGSSAGRSREGPSGPLGTALLVVLGSALVASLLLWGHSNGRPPHVLLRDPATTFDFWPFAGLVSHLGVGALWAAGAICAFAAAHAPGSRALLLGFGAFSVLLAVDDLFMLHESFWPRRGVSDTVVQAAYGLIGVALLIRFRHEVRGVEHLALYAAMAFLATSLGLDVVLEHSLRQVIFEDVAKFMGLLLWSAYWISRAHGALRRDPVAPG